MEFFDINNSKDNYDDEILAVNCSTDSEVNISRMLGLFL